MEGRISQNFAARPGNGPLPAGPSQHDTVPSVVISFIRYFPIGTRREGKKMKPRIPAIEALPINAFSSMALWLQSPPLNV